MHLGFLVRAIALSSAITAMSLSAIIACTGSKPYSQSGSQVSQYAAGPYIWPFKPGSSSVFSRVSRSHPSYQNIGFLQDEMEKFSTQVGTCLHRDHVGQGEIDWSNARADNCMLIDNAIQQSTDSYCNEVVERIINVRYEGSAYCQYGNCGEGRLVSSCLAYAAGFEPNDILLCASANDHTFTLLPDPNNKNTYCVLDRFDLYGVGFSFCGATLTGKRNGSLELGNRNVPRWYDNLTCATFEEARQAKSVYNVL